MEATEVLAVIDRLSAKTRRCMRRSKWRLGKKYIYKPRADLLNRIMEEFNCSRDEALSKLNEAKKFILNNPQYY